VTARPLHLDFCSHEAAKHAVMRWHYSRAMPKSRLALLRHLGSGLPAQRRPGGPPADGLRPVRPGWPLGDLDAPARRPEGLPGADGAEAQVCLPAQNMTTEEAVEILRKIRAGAVVVGDAED